MIGRSTKDALFFEDEHFECPKYGSVKEAIEVIRRQKVKAKEWGKETWEEKGTHKPLISSSISSRCH